MQEVFLKLWNKREQLPGVQDFRPWCMTLARHHIIDQVRKQAKAIHADTVFLDNAPDMDNSTDHRVRKNDLEQLLQQAVEHLSGQQRTIYTLARMQGLSYEEIGVRLSLSPHTVKTHMARALRSIRGFLHHHGELCLLLAFLQGMK